LTPISTLMIEGYSPKTAVFVSAMQTPFLIKIVSAWTRNPANRK